MHIDHDNILIVGIAAGGACTVVIHSFSSCASCTSPTMGALRVSMMVAHV